MRGNWKHLCWPIMRSNCCRDSHSTTRRVSCKKGSISSEAPTQACSPPLWLLLLLLLLLWDIAGIRGGRLEIGGWGDGVIVFISMRIRCPHENGRAAFSYFSTLRAVFKKVRIQALRFQDPCRRSAKTMQYMCVSAKDRFHVDSLLLRSFAHVQCLGFLAEISLSTSYAATYSSTVHYL